MQARSLYDARIIHHCPHFSKFRLAYNTCVYSVTIIGKLTILFSNYGNNTFIRIQFNSTSSFTAMKRLLMSVHIRIRKQILTRLTATTKPSTTPPVPAPPSYLHPLHGEEGGEVGGEGGQHQNHKQPVGGHQRPARERLGCLAAALGRE